MGASDEDASPQATRRQSPAGLGAWRRSTLGSQQPEAVDSHPALKIAQGYLYLVESLGSTKNRTMQKALYRKSINFVS